MILGTSGPPFYNTNHYRTGDCSVGRLNDIDEKDLHENRKKLVKRLMRNSLIILRTSCETKPSDLLALATHTGKSILQV